VRLALLSDIHGNLCGLDACLADLARQGGADRVVAAGDLCLDGPRPRQVLERLAGVGAACLRGNTDRYIALGEAGEDPHALQWQRDALRPHWVAWLRDLPFSLTFGSGEGALFVCHANPCSDHEHVWPDADDAFLERITDGVSAATIAFGHLHLPYVRVWRGRTLVNVASAGLPKDGDPRAGYALLTQRSGGWEVKHRRVAFDVERVARELAESGMPGWEHNVEVLRRHRYKELRAVVP
jgi:predicted phosphodiesterase